MTTSTTIPQARLAQLLHASLLVTPLLFFSIPLGALPLVVASTLLLLHLSPARLSAG